MKDSDKPKLVLALVLLAAAAALILWYTGVFSGATSSPPAPTPQGQPNAGGPRKAPGK